jgi:hypothetical protein
MIAVGDRLAGLLVLGAVVLGACALGQSGKFELTNPRNDSSYNCPNGSNSAPYNFHGDVDVDNGTSGSVSIKSVSVLLTAVAVHGNWIPKAGDRVEVLNVQFSPKTFEAGKKATLKITVPLVCTNSSHQGTGDNYGDYTTQFTIVTSSSTYKLTSRTKYRVHAK